MPKKSSSASESPAHTDSVDPESLNIHDLEVNDNNTAIYLALLESPTVTTKELLHHGFSKDFIERAMDLMLERGIARRIGHSTWQAQPPDLALPAFATRLEEYARTIRRSAPALSRVYASNSVGAPGETNDFQRLTSVDAIAYATRELIGSAGAKVVAFCADTPYTRWLVGLPDPYHHLEMRNYAGDQMDARATLDVELLTIPGLTEVLDARSQAGEGHRISSGLPFTAFANDRGHAVLDFSESPDADEIVGLSVTEPHVARATMTLIETVWRSGNSWERVPGAHNRDDRDRQILQMLAGGATDSTIARSMNVSQRTIERRVRNLMETLGSSTRFQAGVVAAKRGLI
ncbi:helix-turn-helix transcriptional regulator [Calidifontibacter terrae]